MTEEQADQIIGLLKDIKNHLAEIGSNTSDISSVDSNTYDALQYLKNIERS